ncbi:hypothetical protein CR162_10095 [Pseudoroseomonas rhizosphaerae]|uniref:Uncharacterized protein n=1 Tax=Teichococcus rhizosphaerae TaxID=1335062 RepID=A0A2C6Z9A9_9PROT|nr:hypothetical protein [Pseudoroseomonas rhizosphaerae]PHK95091.1 hypothetical protein CR162_10095 [Pseudoroseomonas rhizosphaerae]
MTDKSGLRLWPLALMGWLAAHPSVEKEAAAEAPPGFEEEAEGRHAAPPRGAARAGAPVPGARAAWLGTSRALYAHLSDTERARLRAERKAARRAGPFTA